MKKVLLSEDTPDEVVKSYIDAGFKPYFLSKRKIRKKDKKTWNKIQRWSLDPAVSLVFGEVKQLDKKYNFQEINVSGDPIWDKLSVMGEPLSKYKVLKSLQMNNMEEAVVAQSLRNDVELKFVTVKVLYTYELRDELSGENKIIDGSRDFCRRMVALDKAWSLEELQSVSTSHLSDMGLPGDIFTYRGGWWRVSGTDTTFPACRHIFKAKVVIE
jgi:hypothetical protein